MRYIGQVFMKTNIIIISTIFFIGCAEKQSYSSVYRAMPVTATISKKADSRVLVGESVFQLDDHFVWGASPIKASDGKYYIVYAAFESGSHAFGNAWVLGSKLGLAVSEQPDRNYKSLGIFYNKDGYAPDTSTWDAQSVHNPHIRFFNGKYYIYHTGSIDPGNDLVKSSTGTLDRRSRIQQKQEIGVIEFKTFDELLSGNLRSKRLIVPRTRVKSDNIVDPSPEGVTPLPDNIIAVNPSVVYRTYDKKYLLYFKGNIYDPNWRGVHGVALSDSPTGPFIQEDFEVFTIETREGEKLSAEDPYVWYNRGDKMFYAIFKDFTGAFTKQEPGLAIMKSSDGIKWELTENSLFMKKEVILHTGDTIDVDRLERPQLLLDKKGNPIALFAACSVDNVNQRKDGSSFNIHIPLTKIQKK